MIDPRLSADEIVYTAALDAAERMEIPDRVLVYRAICVKAKNADLRNKLTQTANEFEQAARSHRQLRFQFNEGGAS